MNFALVGTVNAGFAAGSAPAGIVACEVNSQFLLHFKVKEISELIIKMSKCLKNLLKYFIRIAILIFSNSVLLHFYANSLSYALLFGFVTVIFPVTTM